MQETQILKPVHVTYEVNYWKEHEVVLSEDRTSKPDWYYIGLQKRKLERLHKADIAVEVLKFVADIAEPSEVIFVDDDLEIQLGEDLVLSSKLNNFIYNDGTLWYTIN